MIKFVVFTAEWCTFCQRLKPYTDALIESETVSMGYLDIDDEVNGKLAKKLNVTTIPTVMVLETTEGMMDTKEVERVVNPNPKQLKDLWEKYRGEV